ncbi:LysE family translocator [Roseovarius sp. EC-SD190]|uniref:LysE family translocator n=1 Tax=Roseovarius sp. EC-SD190 TaxID=2038395 RepID=UPI00125ECEE1|nr:MULTISPECIES: LysE family translocator [unclassified Roseovarius]
MTMTQLAFALVLFLLPLAYSPGPGNLFFAANGARFGMRATFPASFGYHIATWLVTAAIGFGFIGALEAAPGVFVLLKLAGALYVFWIAWGLLRAGARDSAIEPRPASFRDGAVLLLLNPKAYVIIALMFTQFLSVSDTNRTVLVLGITTIFTLNNLVAFTLWTMMGARLGQLFARAGSARALNTAFGVTLGAVALWMLLS